MTPSFATVVVSTILFLVLVQPGRPRRRRDSGSTEYGKWKPIFPKNSGGHSGSGSSSSKSGSGSSERKNKSSIEGSGSHERRKEREYKGGCVLGDSKHRNKETWEHGYFKFQCKDGKSLKIRCVTPEGFKIKPVRFQTVRGIKYRCNYEPGTKELRLYARNTRDPNAKEVMMADFSPNAAQESMECRFGNCPEMNLNKGATCSMTGDPHTVTFDGARHHYQGTCRYTAITGTREYEGDFRVSIKAEHRGSGRVTGGLRVSYVSMVEIAIDGAIITLEKGGVVKLNGVRISAPYVHPLLEGDAECNTDHPCEFTILPMGHKGYKVSTNFGLAVAYDGESRFYASLQNDEAFRGKVHGVCGYYDGSRGNDYKKPNGGVTESYNEFGDSWIEEEEESDKECTRFKDKEEPPVCDEESQKKAEQTCDILTNEEGPFSECFRHLPGLLNSYRENCIFDVCAIGDPETVGCVAVEPAAFACQTFLGKGINWRTPEFCPPECDENMEFRTCTSPVMPTCLVPEPQFVTTDADACAEGCFCKEEFVLENGKCIRPKDCGCLADDGTYHPKGSTWVNDGCGTSCTCLGKGNAECVAYECPGNTICKLGGNGVMACECEAGFQKNGDLCEEEPETMPSQTKAPTVPVIPPAVTERPASPSPQQTTPRVPPDTEAPETTPKASPATEALETTPEAPPATEAPGTSPKAPPATEAPETTPKAPPATEAPGTSPKAPPATEASKTTKTTAKAPPATEASETTSKAPPATQAPGTASKAPPATEAPITTPKAPLVTEAPAGVKSSSEVTESSEEGCAEKESYIDGQCSCTLPFVRYPDGSCNAMVCQCH